MTAWTVTAIAFALVFQSNPPATAQLIVTPIDDMVLDSNALVLANDGTFGRIINTATVHQDSLITHEGYQYAAWYHNGADDEDIYVSRRNLAGNVWETIDTGYGLENGDATASSASRRWDSHNVISMGISDDGSIHLSYDQHVDGLRYLTTEPGVATSTGGIWSQAIFKSERDSLNENGAQIPKVTYPRFTKMGDGLAFTYRDRVSQDGDHYIANYDSQTGLWSTAQQFTDGRAGSYIDVDGNSSSARNAYLNGVDVDNRGRMHITWTWREQTPNANHDIHYAYSDDLGATWKNNAGVNLGSTISLNSPGIEVVDLDIRQALINQQGQVVDAEGGVHVLMRHRRQEPGFEWQAGDSTYDTTDAAYHHYYRDPATGTWDVNRLPVDERVGTRPQIGVDSNGNLIGIYTSDSSTGHDFVVAGAQRVPGGYSEWEILYRDQRNFEGTPVLDRRRLYNEGILSAFVQERPSISFPDAATGSPLHVLEFNVSEHMETTFYLQASHPGGKSIQSEELWFDAPAGGTSMADANGYIPGNVFIVEGLAARTPSTGGSSSFAGTLVMQGTDPQLINHTGGSLSISRLIFNSDTLFGQRVDGQHTNVGEVELNAKVLIRQQLDPGGDAAFRFDEIGGDGVLKFGLNTQDSNNQWGFHAKDSDGDFTGSILLDKGNLVFFSGDVEMPHASLQILDVDADNQISLLYDATFMAFEERDAVDPTVVTLSVAPGVYTASDLDTLFGTVGRFTGAGMLTVLGPQALTGDFNGDGFVTLADYTVWRDNQGATEDGSILNGAGNGGIVDGSDYSIWKSHFGVSSESLRLDELAAVPEPPTWILLYLSAVAVRCCRHEAPTSHGIA